MVSTLGFGRYLSWKNNFHSNLFGRGVVLTFINVNRAKYPKFRDFSLRMYIGRILPAVHRWTNLICGRRRVAGSRATYNQF